MSCGAIADKFHAELGLGMRSPKSLSLRGKALALQFGEALLEAGDEIIIPIPYWVSYADQALLNDATPVLLSTKEEDGYAVHTPELERLITPRTKAIIVNSLRATLLGTYDRATLEQIASVAVRHDLLVISDEIYEKVLL